MIAERERELCGGFADMRWRVGFLILVSIVGAAGSVIPSVRADAIPKPHGISVTVTPEMRGAGVVSSGVTLPTPPPVTGSR